MKNIFDEHKQAQIQGFVLNGSSGVMVRTQPLKMQKQQPQGVNMQQIQGKGSQGIGLKIRFAGQQRQQQKSMLQMSVKDNKDKIMFQSKNSHNYMNLSENVASQVKIQQTAQKQSGRRQFMTNVTAGAISIFGLSNVQPAFALPPPPVLNKEVYNAVMKAGKQIKAEEKLQQQNSAVNSTTTLISSSDNDNVDVYFGVGCFWHVQHEFVEAERSILGRSDKQLTSWAGYAGGTKKGSPEDSVCYHNALFRNDYGKLGHGEVVSMQVPPKSYKKFAEVYAGLFDKNGDRPDKGDRGPEYRHLVGIPGGVQSPLYKDLEEVMSKQGIQLVAGKGDDADNLGKKSIWVMDAAQFPSFRAEAYHQYHDGFMPGENYPQSYNQLKDQAKKDGRLENSKVCPDEGTWEAGADKLGGLLS